MNGRIGQDHMQCICKTNRLQSPVVSVTNIRNDLLACFRDTSTHIAITRNTNVSDVLSDIWTQTTPHHSLCWYFLDISCWTCMDVSEVKYLYVTVQRLATIDKAGT